MPLLLLLLLLLSSSSLLLTADGFIPGSSVVQCQTGQYNKIQYSTIQYNNTHHTKLHTTLQATLYTQNYAKKVQGRYYTMLRLRP
jgi:hypothetical protein